MKPQSPAIDSIPSVPRGTSLTPHPRPDFMNATASEPIPIPRPLKIGVVEDEFAARNFLLEIINRLDGFECDAVYASAEAALQRVPDHPPHLLLVDLELPGIPGCTCIQELRRRVPTLKIVALTKFDLDRYVFPALQAGAQGYLLKPVRIERLPHQLRRAWTHAYGPLSEEIADRLVADNQRQGEAATLLAQLSPRELACLDGFAHGKSFKSIAAELGINFWTVRTYRDRICEKIGRKSIHEVILLYGQSRRGAAKS